MDKNELFVRFVSGAFVVLLLYGAGMTFVIVWGPPTIASRMVVAFSAMFSGVLGLGTGYLLGKNGQ